ncbi:trypsin-like serine peptidase [Microtetraspora glauca]|uniref:Serine protease n=1 Tax=Microtetraspora glauca TaxID=1996 RepID=A0ABV3GEY8_MICGL
MKRVVLPAGCAAVTAGLLCSSAFAGSGTLVPASARAYDITATRALASEAQVPSVMAYWLAGDGQALTDATPYGLRAKVIARQAPQGGAAADGKPGGVRPAAEKSGGVRPAEDKKAAATSKNVNLPRTAGRVFFTGSDGKPYWCAGTSVQARYRNLVATAGHCVFDTENDGAPMRNWIFIPGHQRGTNPFGVYAGKQAFTHHDFATYRDLDRDYAFVTVYNGLVPQPSRAPGRIRLADGGPLADGVGGQGLAFNQEIGRVAVVFGHFGPKVRGATFRAQDPSIRADELIGLKSSRTADGSAWLIGYRKAGRLGYLNGITITTSGGAAVSPYFDSELYTVYTEARRVRSGAVPGGTVREGANEINIL